jgi:excisionase family DNA binding protein
VSVAHRLHDPERVVAGAAYAIERARARGSESVEPDDLLAGLLLSVARFGIIDLGPLAIDLEPLGLGFDESLPSLAIRPHYSAEAASVFERAARVARGDGGRPLAPVHLLVALGDGGVPTFARLAKLHGLDPAGWRRLLSALEPPSSLDPVAPSPRATPAVPDLLTPDEAAELLGVHIQTLRGYIRRGRLPALRVAGQRAIRVRRDELLGLLEHLRAPRDGHARPLPSIAEFPD